MRRKFIVWGEIQILLIAGLVLVVSGGWGIAEELYGPPLRVTYVKSAGITLDSVLQEVAWDRAPVLKIGPMTVRAVTSGNKIWLGMIIYESVPLKDLEAQAVKPNDPTLVTDDHVEIWVIRESASVRDPKWVYPRHAVWTIWANPRGRVLLAELREGADAKDALGYPDPSSEVEWISNRGVTVISNERSWTLECELPSDAAWLVVRRVGPHAPRGAAALRWLPVVRDVTEELRALTHEEIKTLLERRVDEYEIKSLMEKRLTQAFGPYENILREWEEDPVKRFKRDYERPVSWAEEDPRIPLVEVGRQGDRKAILAVRDLEVNRLKKQVDEGRARMALVTSSTWERFRASVESRGVNWENLAIPYEWRLRGNQGDWLGSHYFTGWKNEGVAEESSWSAMTDQAYHALRTHIISRVLLVGDSGGTPLDHPVPKELRIRAGSRFSLEKGLEGVSALLRRQGGRETLSAFGLVVRYLGPLEVKSAPSNLLSAIQASLDNLEGLGPEFDLDSKEGMRRHMDRIRELEEQQRQARRGSTKEVKGGWVVEQVWPDGAGALAGFQLGDVLMECKTPFRILEMSHERAACEWEKEHRLSTERGQRVEWEVTVFAGGAMVKRRLTSQ